MHVITATLPGKPMNRHAYDKMNDINKMWSICHDCPYWEVCDPPYNCVATEQKIKALFDDENKGN